MAARVEVAPLRHSRSDGKSGSRTSAADPLAFAVLSVYTREFARRRPAVQWPLLTRFRRLPSTVFRSSTILSARCTSRMKRSPVFLGTIYCILAALGYTITNAFLRYLAGLGADEMWVICVKEAVTVCVIGPWILVQYFRRQGPSLRLRVVVVLMLIGLAVQLCGNVSVQWAFGVVGLAVTMPAVFGTMIVGSAVLGWLLLGEAVSRRTVAAMGAVIVAIVMLSTGAASQWKSSPPSVPAQAMASTEDRGFSRPSALFHSPGGPASQADVTSARGAQYGSPPSLASPNEPRATASMLPLTVDRFWGLLGVAAACMAGLVYAALGIGIRWATQHRTPISVIVFIVTSMGVLSLGSLSLVRVGFEQLLATDLFLVGLMLSSGIANLLGFLAITKGLELVPVAHANVVNASQVALGAVLGVLLFGELLSLWLVLGVALTVAGMLLVGSENGGSGRRPGTESAS